MLLQQVEHTPNIVEEIRDRYGTILELLTWGTPAGSGEKVSTLRLARDGGDRFLRNFWEGTSTKFSIAMPTMMVKIKKIQNSRNDHPRYDVATKKPAEGRAQ